MQDTISLPIKNDDGEVAYTIDGVSYSSFYPFSSAAYGWIGKNSFLFSNATGLNPAGRWSIYVVVDSVNGPGSYPIDHTLNYNCQIEKRIGDNTVGFWSTISGGSGVVNISSMDTLSRRISGTFNVTAASTNTIIPGNIIISDGVFDNLYYE